MSTHYTTKQLKQLEEFREVLSKTTGRYCTLEIGDPLTYVWSDGKKIGRVSDVYRKPTFVPASR